VALEPGQPSRTSIVVAALRAFGAREPDPAVRNPDALAERIISPAQLQLITEHPIARALLDDYLEGRRNPEVAGMSNMMLIRTRFIDDHLLHALQNGVTQVVILGAGFDTRPYRFADLLKDKKVFEIDYQSTQEIKRRRLGEAAIPVPPNVRFVEVDFKRDMLRHVMSNAGYEPSERTFFIWEGVSMYLSESAVRHSLRTISSYSAPGTTLVMDFAERAMIDLFAKLPELSQHKYTTYWGEPWIFGLPDMGERDFFRGCGLELREILSFVGSEASKRYLTRSDGMSFGSVRGAPPDWRRLSTTMRAIWMFVTRRSRWYAVAKLAVR
jgi:methyltransferase (TIGR00027 family)